MALIKCYVSTEQVACVDLFLNIVQAAIVAVGNDGLATLLELLNVIHDLTAKEGWFRFSSVGLVDDTVAPLG